jgi:amino acid permease
VAAAPLAFLPAKNSYEMMVYGRKMTDQENFKGTTLLVILCYLLAVCVPNIGSVIAITGATVNPFVAFIFPILFYLKIDKSPMRSGSKLVAQFILFIVILVSILGIY